VSRTSRNAKSLSVYFRLTHPPAEPLIINLETVKPPQSCCIEFDPAQIVIPIGETVGTFKYYVNDGAVSGQIRYYLNEKFKDLYHIESDKLAFEVLEKDVDAPKILNIFLHDLRRTRAYIRISTDESVQIFGFLSLQGTVKPPREQIRNKTLR